jgi:hypothetical protein
MSSSPGSPLLSHYIQEAYLRGFIDESNGRVWVYARKRRTPAPIHPARLCKIRGYYRYRRQDGAVEDLEHSPFLDSVERSGIDVIKGIRLGATIGDEDRIDLARYAALSVLRTPAYEAAFMSNIVSRWNDDRRAKQELPLPFGANEVKTVKGSEVDSVGCFPKGTIHIGEKVASMSRRMHIALITQSLEPLTSTIGAMEWKLLFAPQGSAFVTTDNPWAPVGADGMPLGEQGMANALEDCARVLFPLRKDACLMAIKGSRLLTSKLIDPEDAQWVNQYIISNAYNYKICSVPDILTLLPSSAKWNTDTL